MTTKITVDAHAGWDVKITRLDIDEDNQVVDRNDYVVPANTVHDEYIHSNRQVIITEVRK